MNIGEVKQIREDAVTTRNNLRKVKSPIKEVSVDGLIELSHKTFLLCEKIIKAYEVLK